jgi:Kef-type K+ transport system membrane component KefB
MDKILIDIALILIATKTGAIISKKLKLPEVFGALTAGIILGPAMLNLIPLSDNIKLLANIGVIMLMFLAGLETNFEEFKKAGLTSFWIAVMGISVPLIAGTLSAHLFYSDYIVDIFIGLILTATSVSITVETLTELGKLNTKAGINILGAAVIDDIIGLVLISVLLSVQKSPQSGGTGISAIALTIVGILVFCLIAFAGILFVPKLLNKFAKDRNPSRTILTFALAAALAAAFFAESLGIAAITGAYLCGLLFSRYVHKEYLERNVKAISSGFFSLIFFASIGLQASLAGFNMRILSICIVMFVVAVLGKIIGCGAAARFFKFSRSESAQIGVGMVSRGEVAIITANIGLQNHIISQEIFLPTIIVVILTTIITPVLLKLTFSHKNQKLLETHK